MQFLPTSLLLSYATKDTLRNPSNTSHQIANTNTYSYNIIIVRNSCRNGNGKTPRARSHCHFYTFTLDISHGRLRIGHAEIYPMYFEYVASLIHWKQVQTPYAPNVPTYVWNKDKCIGKYKLYRNALLHWKNKIHARLFNLDFSKMTMNDCAITIKCVRLTFNTHSKSRMLYSSEILQIVRLSRLAEHAFIELTIDNAHIQNEFYWLSLKLHNVQMCVRVCANARCEWWIDYRPL